jgi:hypothetical protein
MHILIKKLKMEEKTHYLFGEEVTNAYLTEGLEALLKLIKSDVAYATFTVIEGKTKSIELMKEAFGWYEYTVITEEEYNLIKNHE